MAPPCPNFWRYVLSGRGIPGPGYTRLVHPFIYLETLYIYGRGYKGGIPGGARIPLPESGVASENR